MGAYCPWNNNIIETWDFDGEIHYSNLDIVYAQLKDNIIIKEENNKKEIKIKGIIKKKKNVKVDFIYMELKL